MRLAAFIGGLLLACGTALAGSESLIVHEWGTFTSLQDESGRALPGIDESTEPLPSFVKALMVSDNAKGISLISTPGITMRLETPVVYFHLPAGSPPMQIDSFSATFHGGVLSQWFPDATNDCPKAPAPKVTAASVNTLNWKNFTIGGNGKPPETDSHVWQAPRQVDAANVTAAGMTERYLFYRGVGILDGPVRVDRTGDQIRIFSTPVFSFASPQQMRIDDIWYFDVRLDGSCAFRKLDSSGINPSSGPMAATRADFDESDYGSDGADAMRAQMKLALMKSGLYEDEAAAMLSTWEVAYFKSVGTRVFYIVPRAWVDNYLPIKLSTPAQIERVMVGRIDIVTPRQRELARQVVALKGKQQPIPAKLVSAIGRFAGAIVADEERRAGSTASAR